MAQNAWFRMYSEFATDPKVQSMSEPMQRRLTMLFCLRSSDVLVTLRDDEIAFALRVTEQDLSETKALFIDKKFIDERWNLINWNKRQYISDSSTERTRSYRERLRTSPERHKNADVTAPDTDTDTDTDTEQKHKKPSAEKTAARATRFSLSSIPAEYLSYSSEKLGWPKSRAIDVFEDFRLYWIAAPKGLKTDWYATWQGWCRKENKSQPPPMFRGQQTMQPQGPAYQPWVDKFAHLEVSK